MAAASSEVYIKDLQNGKFFSDNSSGCLRCDRDYGCAFLPIRQADGSFAFQALKSGKYLSAAMLGNITCNAGKVGTREKFTLEGPWEKCIIRCCDKKIISTSRNWNVHHQHLSGIHPYSIMLVSQTKISFSGFRTIAVFSLRDSAVALPKLDWKVGPDVEGGKPESIPRAAELIRPLIETEGNDLKGKVIKLQKATSHQTKLQGLTDPVTEIQQYCVECLIDSAKVTFWFPEFSASESTRGQERVDSSQHGHDPKKEFRLFKLPAWGEHCDIVNLNQFHLERRNTLVISGSRPVVTQPEISNLRGSNILRSSSNSVIKAGRAVICNAVVLHEYTPIGATDIALHVDQQVSVFAKNESGWWEGSCDGKTGYFPGNYVREIPLGANSGVIILPICFSFSFL